MYQTIAYRFFTVSIVLLFILSCKSGDQATTIQPENKYRILEVSDLNSVRKYSYNSNSISKIEISVNSKLTSIITYNYSGSNLVSIEAFGIKENRIFYKYNLFYDATGKINKYEEFDNLLPVRINTVQYDSKNRVSKCTRPNDMYTYEYDNNDNPIKITQSSVNGSTVFNTSTFTYDNKNNYLKKYNMILPIGEILYAGTNNIIGEVSTNSYNGKVETFTSKVEPVYDSEGKLTKSTIYTNQKLENTITFKYESL